MNIHEHQAKELLSEFGAPVSRGIVIYKLSDIDEKIESLKSNKFVLNESWMQLQPSDLL